MIRVTNLTLLSACIEQICQHFFSSVVGNSNYKMCIRDSANTLTQTHTCIFFMNKNKSIDYANARVQPLFKVKA